MSNTLIVAEGKTKVVRSVPGEPGLVYLIAKEDITAGDGKKHDQIVGKAALATRTTCNVFRLLRRHGIDVSFIRKVNETTFLAIECDMIPYEVVVRHSAAGSALERDPQLTKYQEFEPPRVEFYLKTTGKQWRGISIPVDDPYIKDTGKGFLELYDPHKPLSEQQSLLTIEDDFSPTSEREEMARIAIEAAALINEAWNKAGGQFIDIKFEFGWSQSAERSNRKLLLADVIDNDSWRVLYGGADVSKQAYREGADLPSVKGKYELVAQLTDQF